MFKIVAYDNFGRDNVSEWLVCENVKSEELGKIMVKALVNEVRVDGPYMYKLEHQSYKLYEWEP